MVSGITTLSYSLEMDWALMWLTAKFLGHRTTCLRLTLASIIGGLPTLWVLLAENLYAVPWELGLVWPIFMLLVVFPELSRRFWLNAYVLFLALSLVAGGALTAGLNWLNLLLPHFPALDFAMLLPVLLVAAGYWLPKTRVRQLVGRESYGEVSLEVAGQALTMPVLWDSGNQLTDPVLHRPVVIVEMSRAFEWLPETLMPWILAVQQNREPGPVPEEWRGRVGVVSFRTLAGDGRLPVIAVDRALGFYADVWYPMVPVMVGLSQEHVASDRSYAALATPKSLIRYPHERVGA